MKHLFNDILKEEKQRILELHKGTKMVFIEQNTPTENNKSSLINTTATLYTSQEDALAKKGPNTVGAIAIQINNIEKDPKSDKLVLTVGINMDKAKNSPYQGGYTLNYDNNKGTFELPAWNKIYYGEGLKNLLKNEYYSLTTDVVANKSKNSTIS